MVDTAADGTSHLDTSIVPLGERAWRSILDHIEALDDEAETSYLEVKSDVEPLSKGGVAKIAKFLLGAANRLPQQAARHFHGYAVLVIGAQQGQARGVPRGIEAHELEDKLRVYLGSHFPPFEFGRLSVDDAHEVLFVIAQPPQEGQAIFACRKDYPGEKLSDGGVYVRGASNSRPAKSGEIDALVERARGGGKPPIKLDVEVLGQIHRVVEVDHVMGILYDHEEQEFTKTSPPAKPGVNPLLGYGPMGATREMTSQEREEALERWRKVKPERMAAGRQRFLGGGLSGAGLSVQTHQRFIAKPQLVVTFHGCEVLDHLDGEAMKSDKIVEPVVRRRNFYGVDLDPLDYRVMPAGYPVRWENRGEHAEVTLSPESFRPGAPWVSDQDDYVLMVRDPEATQVTVTWALTEEGNDSVTEGELIVSTGEPVHAGEIYKRLFAPG